MNPMFAAAIGSVIRWGLTFLSGYLVTRGIWSEQEAGTYVAAATVGLATLLWSLYQKYVQRSKLVTALASPDIKTEEQIERMTSSEHRPPVSLPKDVMPRPLLDTGLESLPPLPPVGREQGRPTSTDNG